MAEGEEIGEGYDSIDDALTNSDNPADITNNSESYSENAASDAYEMSLMADVGYDQLMEMAVKADVDHENYDQLEKVLQEAVRSGKIDSSKAEKFKEAMIAFTNDLKKYYKGEFNTFKEYARIHNRVAKKAEVKEISDEHPHAGAWTNAEYLIGAPIDYEDKLEAGMRRYAHLGLAREYLATYLLLHESAHTTQPESELKSNHYKREVDNEKFLLGYLKWRAENAEGEEARQYRGLCEVAKNYIRHHQNEGRRKGYPTYTPNHDLYLVDNIRNDTNRMTADKGPSKSIDDIVLDLAA